MKNLIKKIFTSCAIIIAIFTAVSVVTPSPAYAEIDGFSERDDGCEYILGMVSWDCGVNIHDETSLKSGIWTIASNIAVDLTVLAAYLIVGYVVYGGYLYMLAAGDPGKIATSKKALTQAFIGLAIVLLANVILNTIRIALGADFTKNCAVNTCVDVDKMVVGAINWVIGVAGIVALIFIVYGGISYMTSSGDANKIQKAKHIILYACIGLIIVALAFIITAFVSGIIRNADNSSANLINNTIISKEIAPHVKTI